MFLPDYNNNILGIPNSILVHYGAMPHHATLPVLDDALAKQHRNVVLYVMDGLGIDNLIAHAPDGFLMKNCRARLSSVYPCTTVSALATFETGLSPIEHGWLGWSMYFREIGKCVDLFSDKESGTGRLAADKGFVWKAIGYKNLFDKIAEADSSIECHRVSSFGVTRSATNEAVAYRVANLCRMPGRKYIYAYHLEPDAHIHKNGVGCEGTKAYIGLFDRQLQWLHENAPDTLLIVTADHGMTDISEFLSIDDFSGLNECLLAKPSREPRNLSFFVKDGLHNKFAGLWDEHFAGDFDLLTADQVLARGHFGGGAPHPLAGGFLGDFIAHATGRKALWYKNEKGESPGLKAGHAGLLKEEMVVPLIIV